ncbi:hypothetical protein [Erythrobacter sp. WG]|uniref:hypothetical protein n=1 Tax=Erythrobacter sp. WG TaxID=2985510 RepID=UPI00226D56D8|nr:hypothetical protein [Erythrobacter sp. WG]MCX9146584.1 hypothetical protein [Erythrobacter sp. WG]
MSAFPQQKDDALRFITGFELKHGRAPSIADLADGQFAGSEAEAEYVVRSLVAEGRVRRGIMRNRKLQALQPIAIPRAPDGEPLHFVRVEGTAA